jgi:hypothetical protein
MISGLVAIRKDRTDCVLNHQYGHVIKSNRRGSPSKRGLDGACAGQRMVKGALEVELLSEPALDAVVTGDLIRSADHYQSRHFSAR